MKKEEIETEKIEYALISSIIFTLTIFLKYPSIDWTTTLIRTTLAVLNYISFSVLFYKISELIIKPTKTK